ncbi:ABC transporter ATP-binding protein [Guggenheimella bovis]
MKNLALEAKNLKKYYEMQGHRIVKALDGVDLSVEKGEFLAVVGSSGSGKTTLLHLLGGLDFPTEGRVTIEGHVISDMNEDELTEFRRRNIGFVFQNFNLVPMINVYENIVLPLEIGGDKVDKEFVDDVIGRLGLKGKRNNLPHMLSGGQQQRVAIARSLAVKPSLILADEPTGNLDKNTSLDVVELLREAVREFGQTVVMITHDDRLAAVADRIIVLEDGKVVSV